MRGLLLLSTILLLCAGCGSNKVVMPGDYSPVYTVSCDDNPNDCLVGAQVLCNGPYELESRPDEGKKAKTGGFGWVDTDGTQSDMGGGAGGKYSIRIRCR